MTRSPDSAARAGDRPAAGPAGYAFNGFLLDLRRVGVWKDGVPVPLEPKSFDVLRYLIEHRDRLVGRDEILDAVWTGTFVTPNALTRAVARLRKALGDNSENGAIVQTVSKRGYRFVAPVSEIDDGASTRAPDGTDARGALRTARMPGRVKVLAMVLVAAIAAAAWWGLRGWQSGSSARPRPVVPLTASGNVVHAALSPGGDTIAYVESAGGLQGLWLRQIDGANAIALVPPAPVEFWGVTISPDARSIYYVLKGAPPHADPSGTLFRIPLFGGAPAALANGFDSPAAISPDGRSLAFLRAGHPADGASALMVADIEGGGARAIAVRRAPELFAPSFYAAPSWSPKGDRIATALRNVDTRRTHLAVVEVATGALSLFEEAFAAASFTAWPDDRRILFSARAPGDEPATGGTAQLWQQPLPDGSPSRVTTDVIDYRSLSVTADGSALAAVGTTNAAGLWLIPLDGSAARKLPATLRTDAREGVAWLDASTLVFTSPVGASQQIWTMAADGSDRRVLTAGGSNAWPRPAPGGDTIYFASIDGADEGIWRMRRDGSGRQLVARARNVSQIAVTPDGSRLFFTAPSDALPSTWTVAAGGGTPSLAVKGLSGAVVSPDGQRLAGFWRPAAAGPNQVAVFPVGGGTAAHVAAGYFGSDHWGAMWWTPDGSALLFTTTERSNVWRRALAGGDPVRLTDLSEGAIVRGDLSPDGRTLVTMRGIPVRDVYLLKGF